MQSQTEELLPINTKIGTGDIYCNPRCSDCSGTRRVLRPKKKGAKDYPSEPCYRCLRKDRGEYRTETKCFGLMRTEKVSTKTRKTLGKPASGGHWLSRRVGR